MKKLALLALGACTGLFSTALSAQGFQLVDLRPAGTNQSRATGINNLGEVTGTMRPIGSNSIRGFYFDGTNYTDIGTLGGPSTNPWDINDAGWIVGDSDAGLPRPHAFLYQGGFINDLGTLGGAYSFAAAVNDRSQIVGLAQGSTGPHNAFLWLNGGMTALGALGGTLSTAYDINERGEVVGQAGLSNPAVHHAFVYRSGAMVDLGTFGGQQSAAFGVNDRGWIVGFAEYTNREEHAALWDGNGIHDLGNLPTGNRSRAIEVNDLGMIVGWGMTSSAQRATLWLGEDVYDLNDLIPAGSGWALVHADDLNEFGQIVGYGHVGGEIAAYLLEPDFLLAGPGPGVAGRTNTLAVLGATPGRKVHFLVGKFRGRRAIPGCPNLQLDLKPPLRTLGFRHADTDGIARLPLAIPSAAAGRRLVFQAVSPSTCRVSQPLSFRLR